MKIVVIGGGASGMIAAGIATRLGAKVTIIEKNEKLGKKIYVTGKGRCNLTNADAYDDFIGKINRNPNFLRSCFSLFFNEDVIKLINDNGVPTKVERGNRVFPESDKSSDIIKALAKYCADDEIILNTRVIGVIRKQEHFEIKTDKTTYIADKVIVATGGITYKETGSTGDGYVFAKKLGHTVSELSGVLCGFNCDSPSSLSGLSLKNVNVTLISSDKTKKEEFGELLFTHTGVSGPTILSLSAFYRKEGKSRISIDLKPALDENTLDARIIREIKLAPNKNMNKILATMLPLQLIDLVLKNAEVDFFKKGNSLTSEERKRILLNIKSLNFNLLSKEDDNRAVITRGGISTKEINPKTMESKLIKGLYFVGETLDVDAMTGGYNLQIAFSTGYAAGYYAASEKE